MFPCHKHLSLHIFPLYWTPSPKHAAKKQSKWPPRPRLGSPLAGPHQRIHWRLPKQFDPIKVRPTSGSGWINGLDQCVIPLIALVNPLFWLKYMWLELMCEEGIMNMGVSTKIGVFPPKRMVKRMGNPKKNGMKSGYPYFRKHPHPGWFCDRDLFWDGYISRLFKGKSWPPTIRGYKGHFESPGSGS